MYVRMNVCLFVFLCLRVFLDIYENMHLVCFCVYVYLYINVGYV